MSQQANSVGRHDDWKVTTGTGTGAETRRVQPIPDSSLRQVHVDGGAATWRSSGERPCFRVPAGRLDAGWYEFRGRLELLDGATPRPCLYPVYTEFVADDSAIQLPDPDDRGWLRALVLFKYDLVSLQFGPGPGPARFRMQEFSLSRVSRPRALALMLRKRQGEGAGKMPARLVRFAIDAAGRDLSTATAALFDNYRESLVPGAPNHYEEWVARHDTLTTEHLEDLRERAARLGSAAPLISVLLPTYQTPEGWLRRCIESVLAQAYTRWELCIADDASPDPRIMEVLREYASADQRIRFVQRDANGHISAASNSALALVRGEFVALLDHDDELRPHALLEVAEAIAASPGVELLYSDEDKLDTDGRRFDPYFKPDFDADLLRGQNYICHLTVIRTGLVREVGGFREGFEGSQDHDLILRCTERLQPQQVRHIPKVLYHWRAIPGSTALTREAKDYASSAGARAVEQHLARMHPGAHVEELSHGHFRVRWPLPSPPKVSLIVPTRDKVELLRTCVESILDRSTYPAIELVVVDNQSSEPAALEYLRELEARERVRVLRYDAPFNYSAINNWAIERCDGDVIGLVNNDIEVITPDWLEEMVSQALRADVGAVGAMLYYPNDTIQHAGVVLGIHGVAAHVHAGMPKGYPGHGGRARVAQSLSAVTGACLLVRRAVYERVGGLDPALAVAFNDIDFCLRLREAGYRNVWTPFAELYHHESASRGSDEEGEKRERFAREIESMRERWGGLLPDDPAYNPNLSLASKYFDLAFPPRHHDRNR